MTNAKIKEHVSFVLSPEKKGTSKKSNQLRWPIELICLDASLHKGDRVGLIDKPALKSKVQ